MFCAMKVCVFVLCYESVCVFCPMKVCVCVFCALNRLVTSVQSSPDGILAFTEREDFPSDLCSFCPLPFPNPSSRPIPNPYASLPIHSVPSHPVISFHSPYHSRPSATSTSFFPSVPAHSDLLPMPLSSLSSSFPLYYLQYLYF